MPYRLPPITHGDYSYLLLNADLDLFVTPLWSLLQFHNRISLRGPLVPPMSDMTHIVAKSPAMQRVLQLAKRAASSAATILISGESGTGKERVARFVHHESPRRTGPFVAVNCGAMPEQLLESELFGHKEGSFTGAAHDTQGLFAAADGGTLFLDEIGETSAALQVRLLRVLQERTIRPIGSTEDTPIDVRILAATNRDLTELVAEKTFREDLYYRLRVVPLEIPPLRQRAEDLLPLAREFIAGTCQQNACGPCALSSEVLDLLLAYDWPGNVRELENAIERAVVLAEDRPTIHSADLPPEIRRHERSMDTATGERIPTLADIEKRHIVSVLQRMGGSRKKTAAALDIAENTLWRKLKSYGLVKARPKPSSRP